MKIFIVTAGSRGDVQPYVALGVGLKNTGHSVTICTCVSFEPFIRQYGLDYGYMNDDFMKLVDSEAGREMIEGGDNFIGLVKSMFSLLKESKALNRGMLRDAWQAAQAVRPDVVIYHPKALAGSHIAEKLAVPPVMAVPVPVIVPTAESVAVGFPDLKLGRWFNRLSYTVLHQGYHTYDDVVNHFRQETLGLDKISKSVPPIQTTAGKPIPVLHAHSETVWPRPADWPESAHVTGYWFLDRNDDWQPPQELQAFLEAGETPVYVGFGSMAGRKPQRMAEIVIGALTKAGVRGIIATGWGGLNAGDLPETIFKIDQAPHDWLFERVSAVVHHGGAGTTAAGLRAGRPTVICPFLVDQPLWGARVYQIGVGSKPIPQKKLTVEKLAAAIKEVTTNRIIRQKAEAIGKRIRAEDGISKAIAIIERTIEQS